jgi:2-polyprenyl-3-methyl-5-hydroxy-6-metoxy-1,4-benzoquinol methylase
LTEVLIPYVLRSLDLIPARHVLDVGCGTGELTALLARDGVHVVGVDRSRRSVEIAEAAVARPGLEFIHGSFEDMTPLRPKCEAVIMNMVLMDTPSIRPLLDAARKSLQPNGHLVATITHPAFWPRYWGYEKEPGYSYMTEIAIEAEFTTSLTSSGLVTTHFHRPLEAYLKALVASGFSVVGFSELWPAPEVRARYPSPWDFPRFLGLVARLAGE